MGCNHRQMPLKLRQTIISLRNDNAQKQRSVSHANRLNTVYFPFSIALGNPEKYIDRP